MPKVDVKTKKSKVKKKSTETDKLVISTNSVRRLSNVWKLSQDCLKPLWRYRYVFLGILFVYGVLNLIFAQGFSAGLNVISTKNELKSLVGEKSNTLSGGLTVYGLMIVSLAGGGTAGGSLGYSIIFFIIGSLAIIWAIRNAFNDVRVRIRDAYYKGMYPLVPFVVILLLICIELLPMLAGVSVYVFSINNGIAITIIEKSVFVLLMLLLSALTLFLLSSSLFALYIVTLPDMTPLKALRSARNLVKKRRLAVIARIIYLPVVLFIISAIISLPLIIFAASIVPWVFMLIALLSLMIAHGYFYNLYRELLM